MRQVRRLSAALLSVVILAAGSGCPKQEPQEQVVVAVADQAAHAVMDYDLVAKIELPARVATPGMIRPGEFEKVVGQRLAIPLGKGDILTWGALSYPAQGERLSNIVRKRGRALRLPVDGLGLVRPNDHVDILATLPDPKTGELATVTLATNVIVLAIGTCTGTSAREACPSPLTGEATFMLMPEEVEQLVMAHRAGTLTVSLRNPEDIGGQGELRWVHAKELVGKPAKQESAP